MIFFALAIGVTVFFLILHYDKIRRQHTTILESENFFVEIAGEGKEALCNPIVDLNFDDKGNIHIVFAKDKDEKDHDMYAWIFVYTDYPYTWKTNGDISCVNIKGKNGEIGYEYLDISEGTSNGISVFRVNIKNDTDTAQESLTFKIESEYVVHGDKYVKKILAPTVLALQPDFADGYDYMNLFVDIVNASPVLGEDEAANLSGQLIDKIFCVRKIGDIDLYTAKARINAAYHSTDVLSQKYRLHAAPGGYKESLRMIDWSGFKDIFCPLIEYRNTELLDRVEKWTNILYAIASFIITTAFVELIETILETKKGK